MYSWGDAEGLQRLAQHVVDTLQRRLELDFAGFFMIDEPWAVYWVGTGEPWAQMLSVDVSGPVDTTGPANITEGDGFRLRVGGDSAVGQAALRRQAYLAHAHDEDAAGAGTASSVGAELALPLLTDDELLGVLSLRSRDRDAFAEVDLSVMQLMADQVATAVVQSERLNQSEAAVRDLQATQRRYQQQAWSDYLTVARLGGYESGEEAGAALPEDVVAREVAAALTRQGPVVLHSDPTFDDDHGGPQHRGVKQPRSALVVPIEYSGAAIGALGIHDVGDRSWTEDEVSLVTAVVERMGLAAENLRLLDETQRRVATERLTQSITARMRQTLDVGQVLRAAVQGFAEAFDAAEVAIRLTSTVEEGSHTPHHNADELNDGQGMDRRG